MSRRTGLIILCIALIIAVFLFSFDIYSSIHSSSLSNSGVNTLCHGGCITSDVTPTQKSATALPSPSPTDPTMVIPGYKLIWDDEFNGTQLDTSKWYAINNQAGNQAQSCCLNYTYSSLMTPDQVRVHDGMLTITTERNTGSGYAYRTGAITTETLSDTPTLAFTYGKIDIRARLPRGRGVWPAMWLLTSPATTPAPYEIDLMEMLGQDPHTLYQVVHHGGDREYCSFTGPDYSQAFHVFTLDWEPGKLIWSVDGQRVCTATRYVPSQSMYLIINTALSDGIWGEAVNGSTLLPQTLDIDYVRVYQRT